MRLFPLLIALLLAACGGSPEVDALLAVADSLSGVKPDSALRLLQQQEAGVPHWSKGQRMRHALLTAKAMNKAYVPLTADSLMTVVADYYDRHGTPNEQMEAHYLLGCTYRDLGEAPAALAAYQDAIDRADTLATDCDHALLCRVYSQMAELFYNQTLSKDYLECLDKSIVHANMAGDTLAALNSQAQKLPLFVMQQRPDSVLAVFDNIYKDYLSLGVIQKAAQYSQYAAWAMLKKDDYAKAKEYMELYEHESGYFNDEGDIEPGRGIYYYLKGQYYLSTHQVDSAEYFFRKEMANGLDYNNQNAAAKGLTEVFNQIEQPDSAAKYALYAYNMNDSVYAQMATKEVEHVKSLYDYTRFQKQAQQEKEKAEKSRRKGSILLLALLAVLTLFVYSILWTRKRRKAEIARREEMLNTLAREQSEVLLLRTNLATLQNVIDESTVEKDNLVVELESLTHQLGKKEETICELQHSMAYHQMEMKAAKIKNNELEKSLTYQELHKKAAMGIVLSEEEWEDIQKMVIELLPEFNNFIMQKKYALTNTQHKVCLLMRLSINQASIGHMLDVSAPYITKMSHIIMKKMFNIDGTGKDLEAELSKIR